MKILILLGLGVAFVIALIQGQHKMIYYPRPYPAGFKQPGGVIALEYATSQGIQTAYYRQPAEGNSPAVLSLWLLFAGNASLALEWADFLDEFPDHEAGFLLVDYPGYGNCEGTASPESILESVEKAVQVLGEEIGATDIKVNVMGHSLGAAVALLFASNRQVDKIVLLSPFTSLKDMARLVVGSPLNKALVQDYDNRARLREIVGRQAAPAITIFHGDRDEVVPIEMGRELAEISSGIIFRKMAGGGHNNILSMAEHEIVMAMAGYQVGPEPHREK